MKNRFLKSVKKRKAFTLIEMLISIAIFTIFLGIVSDSYVNIIRGQKAANEVRKMYSEVRDFVDLFSQEVRLGSIDYGSYNVSPGVQSCKGADNSLADVFNQNPSDFQLINGETTDLVVVRKDGLLKTYFHFDPAQKSIQVRQDQKDGTGQFIQGSYKNFMNETVQVENLKFMISPDVDPYSTDYFCLNQKQFQPHVTLLMTIKNGLNTKSEFSINYQTTISSRVYSRL